MLDWLNKTRIRNVRILLIISIIPILSIIFLLYAAYRETNTIRQIYSESVSNVKDAKFDAIKCIIQDKNIQAKQNTNKLKEYIITDIYAQYGDNLTGLKNDISKIECTKLKSILYANISKIYVPHMDINNRVWVANRVGILADKEFPMSPNHPIRPWKDEYNNRVLYKNAIERIIKKDVYGDIIYIDTPVIRDKTMEDIIQPEETGFDTLKDIYEKDGIMGISKYNILVCSYIYDSHDIFNVPDIDSDGNYTNNDTIVIIDQYNIGDTLKDHEYLFNTYDIIIKRYNNWVEQSEYKLINDTVSVMVIMLISFFGILGTVTLYTNWSKKYNGYRDYDTKTPRDR